MTAKGRSVFYASVSPDVEKYVRDTAAEAGISLRDTLDALLRRAKDSGWKVSQKVTIIEGDNRDIA